MIAIVSGYRNINTGIEYAMILSSPKFANTNETDVNSIAQALYESKPGNIFPNVSAPAVIRPIAVFRQASVIVIARNVAPIPPM